MRKNMKRKEKEREKMKKNVKRKEKERKRS
jgi:hypothetical protein